MCDRAGAGAGEAIARDDDVVSGAWWEMESCRLDNCPAILQLSPVIRLVVAVFCTTVQFYLGLVLNGFLCGAKWQHVEQE